LIYLELLFPPSGPASELPYRKPHVIISQSQNICMTL
jgi:hypothetical protein